MRGNFLKGKKCKYRLIVSCVNSIIGSNASFSTLLRKDRLHSKKTAWLNHAFYIDLRYKEAFKIRNRSGH